MFIEFEGRRPKLGANVFVAPTAVLIGDVEVGDNTSIWFGAVLRGDFGPVRIGSGCSIQDNVTVHVSHEAATIIHDDVTVGHNAVLEGCTLEAGCLVGMNSVVLPFATIGEQAMTAAGSVVSERMQVPARVLVGGTPAKLIKELDGSARQWVQVAAGKYQDMRARYLAQGLG